MKRRVLVQAALLLVAVTGYAAGENTARAEATRSPVDATGEALFETRCAACHDARGFGTRILARRAPEGEAELTSRARLPAPLVIAVVRNGLGSMPPIRKEELGDEQLARIAAYLEGEE